MFKLFKSFLISIVFVMSFSSASNARDVTLSMWTHNQLYVDYFNGYLEAVQAEFPDDNITFDFQVTPDMTTNSLTAIASGSEHTDLLGIEISGFGLFMADDIIADNFVPLNDMYGRHLCPLWSRRLTSRRNA
jgi:ABC-type glycerol-3-phosphate transport system substrate-binding protein